MASNESQCKPSNILLSKQVQMVDKHGFSGYFETQVDAKD